MKTCFSWCAARGFIFLFLCVAAFTTANAATNKKPILISQATNTRAVAFESVTMKAEPFPLTASLSLSAPTRAPAFAFSRWISSSCRAKAPTLSHPMLRMRAEKSIHCGLNTWAGYQTFPASR